MSHENRKPCHAMSCHMKKQNHVMPCHVTWKQETMSCRATSCHAMPHENKEPCHVWPSHVTWQHAGNLMEAMSKQETFWIDHSKNTADFTYKSNCKRVKLHMTCLQVSSCSTTTSRRLSTGEAYPEVGRRQQLHATSVFLTLSLTWRAGLYVW